MNIIETTVWTGMQAAMSNAGERDTEATLAALEDTVHRVRVLHLQRRAGQDGVLHRDPEPVGA